MNPNDIAVMELSRQHSLRLAIVTETFAPEVNGVAMTLGHLLEGLLSRGHQIQLVRPRQAQHHETPTGESKPYAETLAAGLPIPRYHGLRFGLPMKNKLLKLWRKQRPDIVHVATEGPLGWSAVAAANALKIPVTSSFHTNFASYSEHYGVGWLKRSVLNYLRKFHNKTRCTLVPTQSLAQDLLTQGYQQVEVLGRGVDCVHFQPQHRQDSLRQAWGIAPNAVAVLYVGRLAPEKNLDLLVQAFTAMRQACPSAQLIIVGDGPARSALASQLPDAHFCGVQTGHALARHYASADVFLFPSLSETFGNVVLEAMASGLPVVAYADAAAADLIKNNINGMAVPAGDAAAFTQAAITLTHSMALRQQLGAAARASAMQHSWAQINTKLEQIFYQVADKALPCTFHPFLPQ